jgi:DNA repair photolyase
MSFTTDPYQPCNDSFGSTREAIKIIKGAGLNVEILTKGGRRACADFDLLDKNDCFATTLTCFSAHDSEFWEPKAAYPLSRVDSLKKAHDLGITTWASLEPVIYPGTSLGFIEQCAPFVDLFKVGKLNYHSHAKSIDWNKFGRDGKTDLKTRSEVNR